MKNRLVYQTTNSSTESNYYFFIILGRVKYCRLVLEYLSRLKIMISFSSLHYLFKLLFASNLEKKENLKFFFRNIQILIILM